MRTRNYVGIACAIPVVLGGVWLALPKGGQPQPKADVVTALALEVTEATLSPNAGEAVEEARRIAESVESTPAAAPQILDAPPEDPAPLVAAVFDELQGRRDDTVAEWRARLAALRDPAAVGAFVEGVTSFAAKGRLVTDFVAGEGPAGQVVELMAATIADNQQLTDELFESVRVFQNAVQAEVWDLLLAAGMSDAEIVPLLSETALKEMTVRQDAFRGLVEDAVAALTIDAGRFAANLYASGKLSSDLFELGKMFGLVDQEPGWDAFLLEAGTDFLIGEVLDQLTDFSDVLRDSVVGRLMDVEREWTGLLEEKLNEILASHRQACEAALSAIKKSHR